MRTVDKITKNMHDKNTCFMLDRMNNQHEAERHANHLAMLILARRLEPVRWSIKVQLANEVET